MGFYLVNCWLSRSGLHMNTLRANFHKSGILQSDFLSLQRKPLEISKIQIIVETLYRARAEKGLRDSRTIYDTNGLKNETCCDALF